MENPLLMHFVTLTIFSLMFAIGVNHSFAQITSLWRQPKLLIRGLFAVIVLVPATVILLIGVLDLPAAVVSALAVLAAAPGAPLTTKRSQMAGGDPVFTASLQLTLALLAIVITPVILNVFYALFVDATKQVSALSVAMQVGKVTFLPVMAGLILQLVAPGISERIGKAVRGFANALFILLFVVLIGLLAMVPEMRAMLNLGGGPTVAILIMVGAGIAIGHGLGGPNQAQRASLAIACIARNVGLALYIAGLSTHGHTLIPTIMTYMILGALLAVPYAVWSKRQLNVG